MPGGRFPIHWGDFSDLRCIHVKQRVIKAWGSCLDCDYEGLLEYCHITGESYDDEEALGVMLLQRCPACGSEAHSLVPMDYYHEMRAAAEAGGAEDGA